jgi:hypothetical protein
MLVEKLKGEYLVFAMEYSMADGTNIESDQMLELAFEAEQEDPAQSDEARTIEQNEGSPEYLTEEMKEVLHILSTLEQSQIRDKKEIKALQEDYNVVTTRLAEFGDELDFVFSEAFETANAEDQAEIDQSPILQYLQGSLKSIIDRYGCE